MNDLYVRGVRIKRLEPGYPFDLPAVRALDGFEFQSRVTFFVGENGTGKSTILEALAVAAGFNAEGGSINFNFRSADTHSALYERITLIRGVSRPRDGFFLRAESFYNMATELDNLEKEGGRKTGSLYDDYGGKSLHVQSHGESFMALVLNRFRGNGLYILDEPEAALSPSRLLALLSRMHALVSARSQFIIATHSPMLMAYPQADIFVLKEDGMEKTAYKNTEHYALTKSFLENPDHYFKHLL